MIDQTTQPPEPARECCSRCEGRGFRYDRLTPQSGTGRQNKMELASHKALTPHSPKI